MCFFLTIPVEILFNLSLSLYIYMYHFFIKKRHFANGVYTMTSTLSKPLCMLICCKYRLFPGAKLILAETPAVINQGAWHSDLD